MTRRQECNQCALPHMAHLTLSGSLDCQWQSKCAPRIKVSFLDKEKVAVLLSQNITAIAIIVTVIF